MKAIKKWGLALSILAASNLAQYKLDNLSNRIRNNNQAKPYGIAQYTDNALTYVASQPAYAGTIYKWVDDNGRVHYSDSASDPKLFDEHEVESFEVPKRKTPRFTHTKPAKRDIGNRIEQTATQTKAEKSDDTRRISELLDDELHELIDKTSAYVEAESFGTDLRRKQRQLQELAKRLNLNFDITNPYKTRLREQFKEVGVLFLSSKKGLGRFEYMFGQIMNESKIDGHIPVTIYSTKGFVNCSRESLDTGIKLGFAWSGEIFINESNIRTKAIEVYNYSKRIRRLRGPVRLICHDFLNYKKTRDNLTKSELIESYAQELIKVTTAHERAHIYDTRNRDLVERETIACLAALRDVPTLSALHDALCYADKRVQKNVRQLFTKYGYDPNSLYGNPVEKISKVAGEILEKECRFYK